MSASPRQLHSSRPGVSVFIFVQDPVGIFDGSLNNLLDPLRVVLIRMNPETLPDGMLVMLLDALGGQLPATAQQVSVELQRRLDQLRPR